MTQDVQTKKVANDIIIHVLGWFTSVVWPGAAVQTSNNDSLNSANSSSSVGLVWIAVLPLLLVLTFWDIWSELLLGWVLPLQSGILLSGDSQSLVEVWTFEDCSSFLFVKRLLKVFRNERHGSQNEYDNTTDEWVTLSQSVSQSVSPVQLRPAQCYAQLNGVEFYLHYYFDDEQIACDSLCPLTDQ